MNIFKARDEVNQNKNKWNNYFKKSMVLKTGWSLIVFGIIV